jgi:hypothetical protein
MHHEKIFLVVEQAAVSERIEKLPRAHVRSPVSSHHRFFKKYSQLLRPFALHYM